MKKTFLFLCALSLCILACRTVVSQKDDTPLADKYMLEEITIQQLHQGYVVGDFTIKEIVQYYLDRIEKIDDSGPQLNSVIQVNPDAIAIAEQLDKELKAGKPRGLMHGVPVLLKDNIDTHDQMETTAGSKALKGSKPLQDSWVAAKLREAGAVILGKANLSEWANFRGDLSSSGWSGVGGQTKNPYIIDRNPCGSSSGSGAAVSANLCMVAIGTETNGSIVCPSSANGIVGIKTTVGLVSRSGVIPISFTMDTPGPMARTVTDAAICLGALTGVDPKDAKTALSEGKARTDYTSFLDPNGIKGKRIGLYTQPFGSHYKVDQLTRRAVELLKKEGAEIIEIDNIYSRDVRRAAFQVMLYEYKDGLNKYFASLGENAPIKNLEELIEFNKKDPLELKYYNQEYLESAQEKK
jgi:amidase